MSSVIDTSSFKPMEKISNEIEEAEEIDRMLLD